MPKVKAIKEHRYGGAQRFPGDEYEASDKDAKLLKAVGKSGDATAQKSVADLPKEVMQRAAPEPEPEVVEEPATPEFRRGEYHRRDMRAEETTELKPETPGRTGEAQQSPSSHPVHRQKGPQRSSPGKKG